MKNDNMRISVIVPVYNAEKFLSRSVESVLRQSYQDIELILVDDGSTDQSAALCNRHAQADPRVRVVSQKNSGPAAARNTGVRHATGTFAFFLDADDFLDERALEQLMDAYDKYHPDLVMGNFSKLLPSGDNVPQRVAFRPDNEAFTGEVAVLSQADVAAYVRHFFKYPSNHLISYCWGRLYKLAIIRERRIASQRSHAIVRGFCL